jgi:hypothetical protein
VAVNKDISVGIIPKTVLTLRSEETAHQSTTVKPFAATVPGVTMLDQRDAFIGVPEKEECLGIVVIRVK